MYKCLTIQNKYKKIKILNNSCLIVLKIILFNSEFSFLKNT